MIKNKFLYSQNRLFANKQVDMPEQLDEILENISRFRQDARPSLLLIVAMFAISTFVIGMVLVGIIMIIQDWIRVTSSGFQLFRTGISVIFLLIGCYGLWVGIMLMKQTWFLLTYTMVR